MSGIADIAKQGLGGTLSAIDLITSLKSGQLGNNLLKRQALLQDPAFRDSISNSPLMAGFLGLGGDRSLQPVDAAPGGPSLPDRQMVFQTHLPALGEAGNLELQKTRLANEKTQAEVPYLQAQTDFLRKGPGTEGMVIQSVDRSGPRYVNPAMQPPLRLRANETVENPTAPGRKLVRSAPTNPSEVITSDLQKQGLTPGTPEYTKAYSAAQAKYRAETTPAPATVVNAVTQGNALLASLDNVLQLSNGATMGPVAGRLSRAIDPFGGNTSHQSQFLNAVEQLQRDYRLATTGQQASYQELNRIAQALPTEKIADSTFNARLMELAKATARTVIAKTQGAKDISRSAPDLVIPPGIAALLQSDSSGPTAPQPNVIGPAPTTDAGVQPDVLELPNGFSVSVRPRTSPRTAAR